jgi:hypothetical protein
VGVLEAMRPAASARRAAVVRSCASLFRRPSVPLFGLRGGARGQ